MKEISKGFLSFVSSFFAQITFYERNGDAHCYSIGKLANVPIWGFLLFFCNGKTILRNYTYVAQTPAYSFLLLPMLSTKIEKTIPFFLKLVKVAIFW